MGDAYAAPPGGGGLRIASWNVNSIRTRGGAVLRWVERRRPDVLLLQETRCTDEPFPFAELAALGYQVAHHGIDHWNGVAIASRVGLAEVQRGFRAPGEPPFHEARLIAATCGGIRCHSVYVPNGRTLEDPHYRFKLAWLGRLRDELADAAPGGLVLVGGDFNVAPRDLDIYDPRRWRGKTHASPPERAAVRAIEELGFTDTVRHLHPEPGVYTWWSYSPRQFGANRGLRIDLVLTSSALTPRVRHAWIDREARGGERPSDHAPVVVDLERSG